MQLGGWADYGYECVNGVNERNMSLILAVLL